MSETTTTVVTVSSSPIDALAATLREESERKAAQAAEREQSAEVKRERRLRFKQRSALLSQAGALASMRNLMRIDGPTATDRHEENIRLWLETTPLGAYALQPDETMCQAAALSLGDEGGDSAKRIEAMLCGFDDDAPPTFIMSGYVK